jgi:hypothetical protein
MTSDRTCTCGQALESAIITRHDVIPDEAKQRLSLMTDKYIR